MWLLDGTLKKTFRLQASSGSGLVSTYALVALPDNQHALAARSNHAVKLFNVNDGAVVRTFKHHTEFVQCLALLPDGRFVSGSDDKTVRIVEVGPLP